MLLFVDLLLLLMLWLYKWWRFYYLCYFEYCFCFEFYIIEFDDCFCYNCCCLSNKPFYLLPPVLVFSFFSIDENLFNLLKSMPPFIYFDLSLFILVLLLLLLLLLFVLGLLLFVKSLSLLLLLLLLLFSKTFCMNPLVSILMLFDDMEEEFWLCRYSLSDYVDWLLLLLLLLLFIFIPLLLLLLLLLFKLVDK